MTRGATTNSFGFGASPIETSITEYQNIHTNTWFGAKYLPCSIGEVVFGYGAPTTNRAMAKNMLELGLQDSIYAIQTKLSVALSFTTDAASEHFPKTQTQDESPPFRIDGFSGTDLYHITI